MAATQWACAREGPTKAAGARARAERTPNIQFIVVTLDVSKLSGWLNAGVSCAESKGGHGMREEVCRPGG